jgi:hypothetical protein
MYYAVSRKVLPKYELSRCLALRRTLFLEFINAAFDVTEFAVRVALAMKWSRGVARGIAFPLIDYADIYCDFSVSLSQSILCDWYLMLYTS